jgi:predicted DNA-binding protein (UPF0251 family)
MSDASDDPRQAVGAAEAWRSWLISGSRGRTADPRRARGSHRGLKKMLIEGVFNGGPYPESWRHFSGAMVRLAINDALNALPTEQTRVVWLAYFAGLSNREIAHQLGLSVAAVQRRLKQALESIAEQIERGRSVALGWVFMLVGARPAGGHRLSMPLAVTAGVAAAAVLAVPPDVPATAHHQAPRGASLHALQAVPASSHGQPNVPAGQAPAHVTLPSPPVNVSAPGVPSLGLPPLPPLPTLPPLPPPPKNPVTASF